MSGRGIPLAVGAGAAIVLLGPALAPGYVLTYDMVFVPRQSLVPAAFGLGDVLPRAVPQDAVLAALTAIAPGQVWQHLMLIGVVVGAATGVASLLRTSPTWARCFGALLYCWSAYLVERLVLGSWPVLIAYAVLPWALAAALRVRRGLPGASAALVLLIALASLAPTGGVLTIIVSLPVALIGGYSTRWTKIGVVLGALAMQAPWLVAALVSPVRSATDPAGAVFALRSEGPWGPLVTALGTGGAWSADVVPMSRTLGLGLAGTLVVVALAVTGARQLLAVVGRSGTLTLVTLSAVGTLLAAAGSVWPALTAMAWAGVPGLSLLRDGQRMLAPLALLLALAAPLGAVWLVNRVADRALRLTFIVVLVALPVLVMPDAAWGIGGRLHAVNYPDAWQRARDAVASSQVSGDVAVLPWSTFRTFTWNGNRTVLDPAPRWMPRPTVVDDRLVVGTPAGVVVVAGESRRAAVLGGAIEAGQPLEPVLRALGIGLVVVEEGTRNRVPDEVALAGLSRVLDAQSDGGLDGGLHEGLSVWAVPGGAPSPTPDSARISAVALAWLAALVALVTALITTVSRRVRFLRTEGHPGDTVAPP